MVTGFGWSAGDIATAIRVISKIALAFKEAGGASEQYAETVAFLEALKRTLTRLKEYIDENSVGKYKDDIDEQAQLVKVEFDKLDEHVKKYDRLASSASSHTTAQEVREKLKWAIAQLRDKVATMKHAVAGPLQFLHTFLSLQILEDIKAVDDRLKQLSDINRINDSALKSAIASQQIMLATIQAGLEGKITQEAESLKQSQNAYSANISDALQQLSRDLMTTQNSINTRLAQLDLLQLLMNMNDQKEILLKMRDAADSHLLELLQTLRTLESEKRSPQWLPLVQTACAVFGAVIGLANFVLRWPTSTEPPNKMNREASENDGNIQGLSSVSAQKQVVVPALTESSTSKRACSIEHSSPNDAILSQKVDPILDRTSQSVRSTETPQKSVTRPSTKKSTSKHELERGSGLTIRSSSASTELSRSHQTSQYASSRNKSRVSRDSGPRTSPNYSSYTTFPPGGYSGGGGDYSRSSHYSYDSPPSAPSRPTYHQTSSTAEPPSHEPAKPSYGSTWSYPLTAYLGAGARITAPTPSHSTPYHTAPSTSYGGPATLSSNAPEKIHPSTKELESKDPVARNGAIWMCCRCRKEVLGPIIHHCLDCGHRKCADCELAGVQLGAGLVSV